MAQVPRTCSVTSSTSFKIPRQKRLNSVDNPVIVCGNHGELVVSGKPHKAMKVKGSALLSLGRCLET